MTDDHDPYDEQDAAGVPGGLPCVELEFATLRRFREEMAPYLNYDGFFARTDHPLPRGTTVEFKFVMPESFVLAHGTAVVSWVIEPEGHPDLVPGMALRFGQVGPQSRAVIDELVDFHVATGGDPFDVGPRADRAGDIPTDSLGNFGGGASSVIDSPAPVPRDLPLPPEPAPPEPEEDGVLPDWLSEPVGSSLEPPSATFEQSAPSESDRLDFEGVLEGAAPSSGESYDFDLSSDLRGDDLDVEKIFESGTKDLPQSRPAEGSFQQMAMTPRPDHKPPRDLRLGLLVSAGLVVVAIVVLGVTLWLRSSGGDEVQIPAGQEAMGEVGVELLDDDLGQETSGAGGEDVTATTAPGDTARPVDTAGTETAGGEEGPAADVPGEAAPSNQIAGSETPAAAPGRQKSLVAEQPPEAMPSPVVQPRASQVVDVVAASRDGTTTVVIRGNGAFDASALRSLRLENPDRLWVSVSPIETFYRPNEIQVGSPEVDRIRIGYHPEDNPPALYVVLDLAGADVVLLETSVQGDAIRLTVGRD